MVNGIRSEMVKKSFNISLRLNLVIMSLTVIISIIAYNL